MSIHRPKDLSLFDRAIMNQAVRAAFRKLDPRQLVRNPVMFATALVAVIATGLVIRDALTGGDQVAVGAQITAWLWFTVLFANFAEAVAEGRGKAQAASLRRTKSEATAKRVADETAPTWTVVPAQDLRTDDLVVCEAGDTIPGDGDVVAGIATVDESAITGESAAVIRESGGDRSAVTGGTRVMSDRIVVRITADPGETFLDRMIALVEGAKRQKTPNEIALTILLVGLTLIFLIVVATLPAWASWSGTAIPLVFLIALFVTLIPTTIGGLLSAIGIAGMDRLVTFNVVAKSGRAVEAAGDIDVLLLDKTGTITMGARQAAEFLPLGDVNERDLAEAAFLASLPDETPEGRSIVALARRRFGLEAGKQAAMTFVPFTAQTRMSGVDLDGAQIRKGAADAIAAFVAEKSGVGAPPRLARLVDQVARSGGTPLVVARGEKPLGVIHLKDIIKPGIRDRFATLRAKETDDLIRELESQHAEGKRRIDDLDRVLKTYDRTREDLDILRRAVNGYTAFQRRHMDLEESELLPLARKGLADDDWAAVDQAFTGDADPLFSENMETGFRALFDRITRDRSRTGHAS